MTSSSIGRRRWLGGGVYRSGVLGCESGSSLIETAAVMPFLLLLLVGAVDFGQAYYVGGLKCRRRQRRGLPTG